MAESLKTSIRPNPNGDWPQVDPTAYIEPTVQVIGNVHIGARVYIGQNPERVLRILADKGIRI